MNGKMYRTTQYSLVICAIAFCGIMLLFSACNKYSEQFQPDYKYEYFPLDSGRYWIYKVDSLVFNYNGIFTERDTISFYMREIVESIFPDNAKRPTARIERSRSDSPTGSWQITDIYFANLTKYTAEKSEENLRFIKLLFPPKVGQTWKGNKYIQVTDRIRWLDNWDYEVKTLDVSQTIGTITFDSTLTVLQRDDINAIAKTYSVETYAKGVGLVYKELMNLELIPTVPWTDPRSGFILKMTIVDYGNN
jgi:hypothetical protein